MHRSVLQNKKYIKFASENTVEVIAMSSLKKGIDANDPKAATYEDRRTGKEYMLEFPGLTVDQMLALASSNARSYNKTGKIPYTSIVDPHTGEEMQGFLGGQSSKTLIEAAYEAKKKLNEKYGPSVSRRTLDDVREAHAEVKEHLAEDDLSKAFSEVKKIERKTKKDPEKIQAKVAAIRKEVLDHASKKLDGVEEMISSGNLKDAKKELRGLKFKLRRTALEDRVEKLKEKLDAAEEASE